MKVSSCLQVNVASVHGTRLKGLQNAAKSAAVTAPPFDSIRPTSMLLSFTANAGKNLFQTASISSEYQGMLDSVYKVGGEGNVAGEAAVALQEQGKMDFRTFLPYYAPDNLYPDENTGYIKIRRPDYEDDAHRVQKTWKKQKFENGSPVMKNGAPVYEEIPAYKYVSVPVDYKLQPHEQFVIHEPVKKGKEWDTGYQVLKETGISGTVKTVSDDLGSIVDVPYKVFAVDNTGPQIAGKPQIYIVHTPKLAVFPQAYGGQAYAGKMFDDQIYSVFSRASVDAMEKMNKEQFGYFNPGNIWLHDRQAFPAMIEMTDRSADNNPYWRGIKAHGSYHNPGRDYQGHYKDPIDFFKIVGSDKDLDELKKNPSDYQFVLKMNKKIKQVRTLKKGNVRPEDILTKDEFERLNEIFKPLYGEFRDELGDYNLCKIPVIAVRRNPYNFSAGTVSTTYGKEMKNHNTKEIAYGLTSDFASIPTVDIVNGSSAKNLHLDIVGNFGRNNGFTDEVLKGFTPLTSEVVSDKDTFYATKTANKKWLMDTIAEHSNKENGLRNLFFSPEQITKKSTVLGNLSKYQEGDVLFIGWGRPDSQKGFPTTLEGFLDYFKNPNIPSETKIHAKALLGAGAWDPEAADWETIQRLIKEIQEVDGGKYKDNICYLNGRFSNRIVACADYSNITSRYEPCGITPLESYAGGTPVISNNTGGSPDFIKPLVKGAEVTEETGFLTKNAYLVNPEVIGAKPGITGRELDKARRIALGKENAECIEQAMDISLKHPDEYKKLMMNAFSQKTDWHENAAFNQGKSAIELYKEKAWGITKDNIECVGQKRNTNPLVALKDKIKADMKKFDTTEISDTMQINVKKGIFTKMRKFFSSFSLDKSYGAAFLGIVGAAALIYIAKRVIHKK